MGTLEIVGAAFLFSLVVALVLVEAYHDWRWKGLLWHSVSSRRSSAYSSE